MEVWRDILLILCVLGVFVFGYFLMARLDKFLEENRKAIEKEEEKKEPSCVMLTEEMSDEDIVEEVKKISEFTTACYYEESVIKNEKFTTEAQWFGNEQDTINHSVVLTVMCKVRAGFDLSTLSDNDLTVRGDTVDIKLPAPKIFDVISNPSDYKIFEESGE